MLPKIEYLLDELRYTNAFDCEFEQHLFLDLLTRLKDKTAPERGFKSKGDSKSFQQRKLITELALAAEEDDVNPSLITTLAAIIDEDIDYANVKKQLQRLDIDAWKNYSQKFLNEVYIPYYDFRKWASSRNKKREDLQDT